MRHLHFTQSLEPLEGGGLGASAAAMHGQMLVRGVDSTLCATCKLAPAHTSERVREFRRIKPGVLYYAPELRKSSRELVARADVVHGHGFYVGTNYLFGRQARRQKKALVCHVHGFFEPWILARSRWKKRLARCLFEDANFRHARLWRALTLKEADQIRACGIKAPIVVIPNGLVLEEFARTPAPGSPPEVPGEPQVEKTKRRVLFLGRVHPKKGLDLLLPAWARLSRFHKDWELVVAGPDEQGYLAKVKTLAASLSIDREARFTGAITGPAKAALLRSADLFVLPSYSEGFPMSLLEAMACQTPVLATRECNFPEISSCQAGWECDASLPSVARALETALNTDSGEREERGRNGRLLVERGYTWPGLLDRLLEACAACC
jgi:glycosyltransferase involved in cell wall biosynthesis